VRAIYHLVMQSSSSYYDCVIHVFQQLVITMQLQYNLLDLRRLNALNTASSEKIRQPAIMSG